MSHEDIIMKSPVEGVLGLQASLSTLVPTITLDVTDTTAVTALNSLGSQLSTLISQLNNVIAVLDNINTSTSDSATYLEEIRAALVPLQYTTISGVSCLATSTSGSSSGDPPPVTIAGQSGPLLVQGAPTGEGFLPVIVAGSVETTPVAVTILGQSGPLQMQGAPPGEGYLPVTVAGGVGIPPVTVQGPYLYGSEITGSLFPVIIGAFNATSGAVDICETTDHTLNVYPV